MVGPRSNRLVYAILFIFGLSCFALASVAICLPTELAVIGVIKGVYFVGSLFLYHRGVAVIHRISQRRPHRCQPGRWQASLALGCLEAPQCDLHG